MKSICCNNSRINFIQKLQETNACTSAIITERQHQTDVLLWKHRDTGTDNRIEYFDKSKDKA